MCVVILLSISKGKLIENRLTFNCRNRNCSCRITICVADTFIITDFRALDFDALTKPFSSIVRTFIIVEYRSSTNSVFVIEERHDVRISFFDGFIEVMSVTAFSLVQVLVFLTFQRGRLILQ